MNGGAGVQVVRLGSGERRYELDEAALRNLLPQFYNPYSWETPLMLIDAATRGSPMDCKTVLLLRPDVRDLPVVVLSVAGAYRGVKSFILDFFLRYLYAPRSSQLSGEWLGNEDEPLECFHWRGGGERPRDTTGIHLWPEPIITTMDNGEKVAVLLMDTQGTFDTQTTIGQNSTIFALSTLISSVQVYNLSGNIREDHLQHLQLFTEYGKLVSDAQSKAFQKLLFLVRDWPNAYEHAHGFLGGQGRRQPMAQGGCYPNQKSELREVRAHIRSCFDQIKCFLMPHPGLAVEDQDFAGRLRDLTEKFRLALLELVPSLFDPKHLTPKLINGERVRTQDLFEYFQQYVNIFNSDDMPEAVTIFKATADACLMAATRAARSLYAALMEKRVCGTQSVTARALTAANEAACADGERCFLQKKMLGSQQEADAQLRELIKLQYVQLCTINEQNNRSAMIEARNLYVTSMRLQMDNAGISTNKLEAVNLRALNEAKELFYKHRNRETQQGDDFYVQKLVEEINICYADFEKANLNSNRIAMQVAEYTYNNYITLAWGPQMCCYHPLALADLHKNGVEVALRQFMVNRPERKADDYKVAVEKNLENRFYELQSINQFNNEQAVEKAFLTYMLKMDKHTRPSVLSLLVAPFFIKLLALLPKYHENCKGIAIIEFRSRRRGVSYDDDTYFDYLKQKMEDAYMNYRSPILAFLRELGVNTV